MGWGGWLLPAAEDDVESPGQRSKLCGNGFKSLAAHHNLFNLFEQQERICQSLAHAEEKEEACCRTLLECVLDSFKLHEGADILGTHRATVNVSKALFVPH